MSKTPKILQVKPFLFKKKPISSSSSLTKRRETIFNKAKELSTLCGIEVCVICYGPGGELNTYPKNREEVKKMCLRYSELSEKKRSKARVDLKGFLAKNNKDDSTKSSSIKHNCNDFMKKKSELGSNLKNQDWDLEGYSEEQVTQLYRSLEFKHDSLQQRFRSVVESREQRRNMQNMNMAYQAQRITTIDTMNHLQQHSNQVSMHPLHYGNNNLSQTLVSTSSAFNQTQSLPPFNYGNNTLSQTLDSTSSAFNQTQSLAPLPSHLMIYPDFNMGDYPVLLGPQEPEFNEFQNANMYGCNSFINNINVEDYLATDMNGFQSMNTNMYGYNNNGLSNQFVQFPTQTVTAAPGFQFGLDYANY